VGAYHSAILCKGAKLWKNYFKGDVVRYGNHVTVYWILLQLDSEFAGACIFFSLVRQPHGVKYQSLWSV